MSEKHQDKVNIECLVHHSALHKHHESSFSNPAPASRVHLFHSGQPPDVHLLPRLCFHRSSHAWDTCFIYMTVQRFYFEQQSNIRACVLQECTASPCTCLKIWNTKLRIVKVKCGSRARDLETEVNEYLPDTHTHTHTHAHTHTHTHTHAHTHAQSCELLKPKSRRWAELPEFKLFFEAEKRDARLFRTFHSSVISLFTRSALLPWVHALQCVCIRFYNGETQWACTDRPGVISCSKPLYVGLVRVRSVPARGGLSVRVWRWAPDGWTVDLWMNSGFVKRTCGMGERCVTSVLLLPVCLCVTRFVSSLQNQEQDNKTLLAVITLLVRNK